MLVNLERCTGCWACSLACKDAHKLPGDEYWQFIRTNGGGGIDEPKGTYPYIYMSWTPVYTQECTLCGDRIKEGEEPYCTYNCPTKAIVFGDADDPASDVAKSIAKLQSKGYHFFKDPVWEKTKPQVLYANRLDIL
jgi:Fe-S-cluster-containing dehydrogenase component